MMSHGKLASPFVYPQRTAAPASKSMQQPGAGPNAGKRKNREAFNNNQKRRADISKAQTNTHHVLNYMMTQANRLAVESETAIGEERLGKLWMARAIAAEVARITNVS